MMSFTLRFTGFTGLCAVLGLLLLVHTSAFGTSGVNDLTVSASSIPDTQGDGGRDGDTQTAAITANLHRLAFPLLFVPNQGQWDERIAFQANTSGATVAFTARAALMQIRGAGADTQTLRLRPLDPSPAMTLTPGDASPTRVSYFVGADPARWRSGIPTHASLRYQGVYPGIDLVFRGDGQRLVYDLAVAPGADPTRIRFAVDGAARLAIASDGSLVMTLADGTAIHHQAPLIYQDRDGQRVTVAGRFVILDADAETGSQVFGFQVADYDRSLALIIDPTIEYSAIVGGKNNETIAAARMHDDSIILAGSTLSLAKDIFAEFVNPGGKSGKSDGLVYRLSEDGTTLEQVVILGGSLDDAITAFAIGSDDSLYVTGWTKSIDLPTLDALYPLPFGKTQSAFVIKLTPDWAIDFATYLGGNGTDSGKAIALDSDDAIYVGGETTSNDLPLVNPLSYAISGSSDGFLIKMKTDGTGPFVLSTYFGGNGRDSIGHIRIDESGFGATDTGSGDIYIAGETTSDDLPIPNNIAAQEQHGGETDAFWARITAASSELAFCTYLGGSSDDYLAAITQDSAGNLILVGSTTSTNFPVRNGLQGMSCNQASDKAADAFVTKLNKHATFYHFSTCLGASGNDRGLAVAVDADDAAIYVAGHTDSTNLPVENPIQNYFAGATKKTDGFVMKLDAYGGSLISSSYFGGTGSDSVQGLISIDDTTDSNSLLLIGHTESGAKGELNFPKPTPATPVILHGQPEKQSSFVSWVEGMAENPATPILKLGVKEGFIPELETTSPPTFEIPLTLVGNNVSAFSTSISYDPAEVGDPEDGAAAAPTIVWHTDLQADSYEVKFDTTTTGTILIEVYQDGTLKPLPNGTETLGTLTFTVDATNIGTIPAAALQPTDVILPSKQINLLMGEVTAVSTTGRDLYVKSKPGAAIFEHRVNALLGDCDFSGQVTLWELQRAYGSLYVIGDAVADGDVPLCMVSDYRKLAATDLAQILINYEAKTRLTNVRPAARMPSATAASAALSFANTRVNGGWIRSDLVLNSGGAALSILSAEIRYNPDDFVGDPIPVVGGAAHSAGKNLRYQVAAPGRLLIDILGMNDNPIPNGVVASISLEPAINLSQTGTRLTQLPSASSPAATAVPVQGGGLALGITPTDGGYPVGTIPTRQPTYGWTPVAGATWYQLWVSDAATSGKIRSWHRASEAQCAEGRGQCAIKPSLTLVNGPASWWVRSYSPKGYGAWSAEHKFQVATGNSAAMLYRLYRVDGARAGTAATLWAQVYNNGTTPLPSDAKVWFYVNGRGLASPWVGSTSAAGISAGAAPWRSLNWRIPSSLRSGTYSYWARLYRGHTPLSAWSQGQAFVVEAAKAD